MKLEFNVDNIGRPFDIYLKNSVPAIMVDISEVLQCV
jgi:hypothetical protein